MSAYIVDKDHILYLVLASISRQCTPGHDLAIRWYHDQESRVLRYSDDEHAAEIANMLWHENIKSVSARYPNESSGTLPGPKMAESAVQPRDFSRIRWETFNPVQVLKACDCFEYQSCEHDGWKSSEAHTFIQALRRNAWHALPGYEDAEWGAPEYRKSNAVSLTSLMAKR